MLSAGINSKLASIVVWGTNMAKFWLQQKAPAGNWVDNMGSDKLSGLISHKKFLEQVVGGEYRIVQREDIEINIDDIDTEQQG